MLGREHEVGIITCVYMGLFTGKITNVSVSAADRKEERMTFVTTTLNATPTHWHSCGQYSMGKQTQHEAAHTFAHHVCKSPEAGEQ